LEWDYDSASASGHYTVTFHDRTQWVTTVAQVSIGATAVCHQLGQILDPKLSGNGAAPNALLFKYVNPAKMINAPVAGSSGFPVLQTIVDGYNSSTLLTFNRTADMYQALTSVADAYGRSVYYNSLPLALVNTPQPLAYLELIHVSPILPTGTTGYPYRWDY